MRYAVLGCIIAVLSAVKSTAADEGWTDLFSGKTLAGWENPCDWREVNSEIYLTTTKKTSFLCFVKQYADFILEAEVKPATQAKAASKSKTTVAEK